jgi:hypothetical protein
MQRQDELLAEKITFKITNNSSKSGIDDEAATKTIVNMLQFAELRPLLEFFANNSDDFTVIIDTEAESLDYSNGVYFTSNENFMHINGKQTDSEEENKEAVRKSLLFGLCQYAIKNVFNNGGKPYASDDDANNTRILSLCWSLVINQNINGKTYGDDEHIIRRITKEEMLDAGKKAAFQTEILACIPKFIWQDKSSRKVSKLYPELADYYNDVFLPAVMSCLQKQALKQDDKPSIFNPSSGATLFSGSGERKIPLIKPISITMARPVERSSPPLAK